jgi:O-methyltransferase
VADIISGGRPFVRDGLLMLTRRAFRRLGLDLYRAKLPTAFAGFTYERVHPLATYAPWRADLDFQATLEGVRGYTLVDEYRLFELWSLARAGFDLEGDILEVGVWRGGSGALLACAAQSASPGTRVFLCDTFRGLVKVSSRDSTYRDGEYAAARADVNSLLESLGLEDVTVLEGVFPDETAASLGNLRLRLCHVDVDVYESARDVLHWVWPRLVPGGVVVFDDYGFHGCDGVTRLVEEVAGAPDRVFVHNLNGHGLLIKTR